MKRVVMPEILDGLDPEDRAAIGSRQDLRRLNSVMGHEALMGVEPLVELLGRKQVRVADIGAGDGTLMGRLARRLSGQAWAGRERRNAPMCEPQAILVDRHPPDCQVVSQIYQSAGWKVAVAQADVFEWLLRTGPVDAIVANLFLHHFQEDALARLLSSAAEKCDLFVACEPRRSPLALTASRLLWAIGCNAVTRHDAAVSVRAGFRGQEISALWSAKGWKLREEPAGWFSHRFVAAKK